MDKALENTVVYEGNSASFPRVNNNQTVTWQFTPSSATFNSLMDITYSNDTVIAEFNSMYAANQSALIIFNSTVAPQGSMSDSTAGLYLLNYQNPDCITGAGLVVIGKSFERFSTTFAIKIMNMINCCSTVHKDP